MTLLTLELEPELYENLRREALQREATIEKTTQALLIEQLNLLATAAMSGREQVTAVLRSAAFYEIAFYATIRFTYYVR